jgi:D-amino-acid dehydrogenase
MKVIVLGAGVIGVTSAYFLARAGHQVTVIDKNQASAMSCSYANGGQLSYSHVETWAESISFVSVLKALLTPNSFLSFSDAKNGKFWSWLWRFSLNSLPKKCQQNSENLFKISSYSKEAVGHILQSEKTLDFNYKNEGTLHFYRSKKKLEAAIKNLREHQKFGLEAQVLSAVQCVKKEPTLVKLLDEEKLAGGIFYSQDASGDCAAFTQGLAELCQKKYGVTFEYGAEIKNILTNHQKITGINSSKAVFSADKYVYALGAAGVSLLNGIGVEPRIYPLKGYSISIESDVEFLAPSSSLTDPENKIVYSRLGKFFRAAGSVEICGLNSKKNDKHLTFLRKIIDRSFSDYGNMNKSTEWFGFRPFRPNSLPLICEVKKYGNLLINSGHGSLGFTLSAGSAKILSDLVVGKTSERFSFLEKEETKIYTKKND